MMTADSNVLREAIADLGPDALTAQHLVDGRPLGDACDSLRDLVAHHTMWLEIDLAVLVEAQAGRRHWSTTARWSERPVGQRLNQSGVAAGRILLVDDLLDRFEASSASLLDAFSRLDEDRWRATIFPGEDITLGRWLRTHFSVPGQRPFSHATLHLRGFDGAP